MQKVQFESEVFQDSKGFKRAISGVREKTAEAFGIEKSRLRLSPQTLVFQMYNDFNGQWVNYTDERATMAERIKNNKKDKFKIKTKELILKK